MRKKRKKELLERGWGRKGEGEIEREKRQIFVLRLKLKTRMSKRE